MRTGRVPSSRHGSSEINTLGRYGSCDCICGQCVPGTARPYLDIDRGPWYSVPAFKSGPVETYTVAEVIDDLISDYNTTYAQILYIHNAGSGNLGKRLVLKLYNTLVYAASNTIDSETLILYCADREMTQSPSEAATGHRVTGFLYVYLYEGIYIRASVKHNFFPGSDLSTYRRWTRKRLSMSGGFKITDFSKLYVHIRPSFNLTSGTCGVGFGYAAIPVYKGAATSGNEEFRYPISTITYSGPWGTIYAPGFGPVTKKTIAQALDFNPDSLVYLYVPKASVGDRLIVLFAGVTPETSRANRHKSFVWGQSRGASTNDLTLLSALYQGNALIAHRTTRIYSSSIGAESKYLTETEHKSITNWDDLRWRWEVKSIAATDLLDPKIFCRTVVINSLATPRIAITQLYLSRVCK